MLNRIALATTAFVLMIAAAFIVYIVATPNVAPRTLEASGLALPGAQSADDTGGVYVSGTGKVRLKPNIATTSIGVEITAGTLAEATIQANAKMNEIIGKLKGLGIADKDIQTTSYNIYPITQQPKPGVTPTISGYRVNNQLSVTIRKIDDVGKVLDAVVAAGANNVYGISFSVDDPATYQQQARAAAIKDAQDKAAQLAKAANVTLGKVITINEGAASPGPLYRAAAAPALAAGAEVPVETGELEISVTVEMRFAVQ
jgi:uncharacterized protein YggE